MDFGKEPFYCFFNNTFNKCGIHCGEVDVIICVTDKCVTFVNGRERNKYEVVPMANRILVNILYQPRLRVKSQTPSRSDCNGPICLVTRGIDRLLVIASGGLSQRHHWQQSLPLRSAAVG